MQAGISSRPVRRWSSWYDPRLVIRAGEDILSSHDDWGIKELRRNKMIWRSWGQSQSMPTDGWMAVSPHHGIRQVETDPVRLRMFFLSILWRAAETSLPEFAEIELPAEDAELLRESLVCGEAPHPDFYPIMLTQIATRGQSHNHTPIAQDKAVPDPLTGEMHSEPIFRFYFDGLVAHFHRPPLRKPAAEIGTLVVGNQPKLAFSTVTFEASWQFENLTDIQTAVDRDFPGELDRLSQTKASKG